MKSGLVTPRVSVIIPTMAAPQRAMMLQRAVESIRVSSAQPVRVIVVVNGNRFDPAICDWLKAQPDIHFEYVAAPSAPGAMLRGRELVKTEFFSTLDDDDEYLPGTTDRKVAALEAHAQADLLVGNFYLHKGDVDTLCYRHLKEISTNPLKSLLQFNWLHNGNALYRTASVGINYFQNYHPYAEWTWLAYQLSIDGKKVVVLDAPVFRYYADTLGSLSKSDAYIKTYIPLFNRMLSFSPPRPIIRMIHRKMGAAHHDASVNALRDGRRMDAWRHHFKSLFKTGGLRYLGYTRYLFK